MILKCFFLSPKQIFLFHFFGWRKIKIIFFLPLLVQVYGFSWLLTSFSPSNHRPPPADSPTQQPNFSRSFSSAQQKKMVVEEEKQRQPPPNCCCCHCRHQQHTAQMMD